MGYKGKEAVEEWRAESGAIAYRKAPKGTLAAMRDELGVTGSPKLVVGRQGMKGVNPKECDSSLTLISEEVSKALFSWGSGCDVVVQAGVEVIHRMYLTLILTLTLIGGDPSYGWRRKHYRP